MKKTFQIKKMKNKELSEYIETTKSKIKKTLETYEILINKKLEQITSINDLKKQAFSLNHLYNYSTWINTQMKIEDKVPERIHIIPKRGEIWTCELGQNIGSEENKIRPVIIIQNDTGNEKSPTTIIVPISNRSKKIAVHIELRETDYKLEDGEKNKITGTVLTEQIKVISKARLGRHIATLNNNFMKLLNLKIKNSLEL
ncbi:mRNA interferase MazF [Clostridium acetireducens DSM 10703]|jgi:mRNA interferase MazF|uniref:mRNA interferase MazF n=1 Tax=Clostridium acetireducens DSM 10703 TaxID=1121290 RepID=A0A1E8EX17_9CLOT|nr:type II toxin-antitoxin system PemK/MazF family toxin [Clostridium acetireducens]OFI05338.1 mRNA interferase MazF [Clostridium acetireducens DSM 10703]